MPIGLVLGVAGALVRSPAFGVLVFVVAVASSLAGAAFRARRTDGQIGALPADVFGAVLAMVLVVLIR